MFLRKQRVEFLATFTRCFYLCNNNLQISFLEEKHQNSYKDFLQSLGFKIFARTIDRTRIAYRIQNLEKVNLSAAVLYTEYTKKQSQERAFTLHLASQSR